LGHSRIRASGTNGFTVTGNTASNNGGDGIDARGTVTSNTATSNGGFGLNMGGGGYVGNVMSFNTSGSVNGFGVEIGTNFCGTDTTCP
jgi:parallel beta-helix repeat protein